MKGRQPPPKLHKVDVTTEAKKMKEGEGPSGMSMRSNAREKVIARARGSEIKREQRRGS